MSDTLWSAIVGGMAGVITGSLSSLFAPWVHWGIEKKGGIREARKSIIANAQSMIIDYRKSVEVGGSLPLGTSLKRNSNWMRIKPYLKEDARSQIQLAETERITSNEVAKAWGVLEAELARLRKQWKLV